MDLVSRHPSDRDAPARARSLRSLLPSRRTKPEGRDEGTVPMTLHVTQPSPVVRFNIQPRRLTCGHLVASGRQVYGSGCSERCGRRVQGVAVATLIRYVGKAGR